MDIIKTFAIKEFHTSTMCLQYILIELSRVSLLCLCDTKLIQNTKGLCLSVSVYGWVETALVERTKMKNMATATIRSQDTGVGKGIEKREVHNF